MSLQTTRIGALVLAIALLGGSMTACSSSDPLPDPTASVTASDSSNTPIAPKVADGGEAIFAGFISSPRSWNPLTAQGDTTGNRQFQWPFYPHVFYGDSSGSLELNTDLMESATITSNNPMVVEYKIKANAVWSDGVPIDGDDFLYTWAVQDPRQCSECTAAWTSGYDQLTLSVSADKKTVTAQFDQPFATWKTLFIVLLPAHIANTYGDLATSFNDGLANNVATISGGPYEISDFQKDVSLTMVKNASWYGEPAHLDTIHYRFISEPSEVITAFQNGEVTVVYENPTLETVEKAAQIEGSVVKIAPSLTYYNLIFKTTGDALGDITLRQAISRAINVDEFVTRIPSQYDKEAAALRSLAYTPGQKVAGASGDPYQENAKTANVGFGDVAGATKLLMDNGYSITDGKLYLPDGKPLRDITILTYQNDIERIQMAEIIAAQLKALGISTKIDSADSSRYGTAGYTGQFDILVTATAGDLGVQALDQWYGTSKARNGSGYSSSEFDALVAKGNAELDPDAYVKIMNQMDLMLLNDAVALPLYSIGNVLIHPANFTGIEPSMSKYGTTWSINNWGFLDS